MSAAEPTFASPFLPHRSGAVPIRPVYVNTGLVYVNTMVEAILSLSNEAGMLLMASDLQIYLGE